MLLTPIKPPPPPAAAAGERRLRLMGDISSS